MVRLPETPIICPNYSANARPPALTPLPRVCNVRVECLTKCIHFWPAVESDLVSPDIRPMLS